MEKFEVVKEYGFLSETARGYRAEVNLVRWFGRPKKLDIRIWTAGRAEARKGISLTRKEAENLLGILSRVDFSEIPE